MLAIQRRNAEIYSGTWAGRPTSGIATGSTMYVTDVGLGGSLWIWDGSKWRTVAPVTLTEYYNAAGLVYAAGGIQQLIAPAEVLLPANLFVQGARVRWQTQYDQGTVAESRSTALRLGTASGVLGLTLASISSSAASQKVEVDKQATFVGATETLAPQAGVAVPGILSAFTNTSGYSTASPLYLSPTTTPSASNAITIYSIRAQLEV